MVDSQKTEKKEEATTEKRQPANKQKKSEKEHKIEQLTEEYNLAYIPLDTIEDPRTFKLNNNETKDYVDKYELSEKEPKKKFDYNHFTRGIIYGTQVVLKKIFENDIENNFENEDRKKLIKNLMDIDELEDDLSVSLVHGFSFDFAKFSENLVDKKQQDQKEIGKSKNEYHHEEKETKDLETISKEIKNPLEFYLVREWIKGKSFSTFRSDYGSKVKNCDLLVLVYLLGRIIEHYHKYRLSYLFLRPKKVIVTTDFNVILNDIIKLNSFLFDNKIKKQLVRELYEEEKKTENIEDHAFKFIKLQNDFLHPYLFFLAFIDKKLYEEKTWELLGKKDLMNNQNDKVAEQKEDSNTVPQGVLKAKKFHEYQYFDLYSFGCLFYYFYFKESIWKDKTKSEIFKIYYGQPFDYFNLSTIVKADKKIDPYLGNKFTNLKDNEKEILSIIKNCLYPPKDYTMKSAISELEKIDSIQRYNKYKEFSYNFTEDYKNSIEEFQDIFNQISKLNENNTYDEELKKKLFEFN